MTIAFDAPTTPATIDRIPGRSWTVRLTGHADRTASVTCSTGACRMPPRSRDVAALRAFAAAHAAAHAKAATVRPNAACHCRAGRCAAHEGTRVVCAGGVLLVLRHDPLVGRVWTVAEVCEACAPLLPHATVLARADRPRPTSPARTPAGRPTAATVPAPAPARSSAAAPTSASAAAVPGGFAAPPTTTTAPAPAGSGARSRRRSGGRRPHRARGGRHR